jgi:hypothetical protein
MANIFLCAPSALNGEVRYRVEWQDADGFIMERYYRSYRGAENFSLKIERQLLMEAMADLCGSRFSPPDLLPESALSLR